MKRALTLILSLLLLITCIPMTASVAFADDDSPSWLATTDAFLWYDWDKEEYNVCIYTTDYRNEYEGVEVYRSDNPETGFELVGSYDLEYHDDSYTDDDDEYHEMKYSYGGIDIPTDFGVTSYYKVRAFSGLKFTAMSPVIFGQKITPETPFVSAKCTGTQTIKLSFYGVPGADGFYIYRYNKTTGKYVKVKDITDPEKTSWLDKNRSKNTTCKYKIAAYAYDSKGNKVFSKKSPAVTCKTCSNVYNPNYQVNSGYYNEYNGLVRMEINKIYYEDGKLVLKAPVINCTDYYVTKFNWVKITVYDENENIIADQRFKDKKLELDSQDMKDVYFKFSTSGTKNKSANLRYYASLEWECNYEYLY